MHELLIGWVRYIVPAIEIAGVAIVLWGLLEGIIRLLYQAWRVAVRRPVGQSLGQIRHAIGEKVVLGLEFFIAGDVIQTVVVPSWESLGILAGIVAIRTAIVYFLDLEMRGRVRA